MEQVEFRDLGFEKEVRKCLKKSKKKLTRDDLLKVTGILITDQDDVNGFSVPWQSDSSMFNMSFPNLRLNGSNFEGDVWLEDLKNFKHIETLHIYVGTKELSFLDGFEKLKELYIIDSSETSWSFIEGLLSLRYLCVRNAEFSNLAPISALCNKQLSIHKKNKEEANGNMFFSIFRGLQNLMLDDCNIVDLSPLSNCSFLSDINLSNNRIKDLAPLITIASLYYLTLRYNEINDISPLKGLQRLYLLNLRHNQIEDVSVLETFENSNLSRLFVEYNNIVDYSPLAKLNLVYSDLPSNIKRRGE